MSTDPVRRFYKSATVSEDGAGVKLDERNLKTSGGNALKFPSRELSGLVAQEWDAQGEFITPSTMPITQLAFAAIDWTPSRRDELADYVAKFGETDLVCHRAEGPAPLVARQGMIWNPLVAWGASDLGVVLPVVTGVTAAFVHPETMETLRAHAAACDDFQLTALAQAAGLSGSAIIAFALLHGRLDAATAFTAGALDDLYSLQNWGEDAEARARLERQRGEYQTLARFFAALEAG
jgi:chaperone required for assembly of F1-ATPase